ncbi:trypsin-like [Aricia agestis]|uniref:trypsin-like n=1 Tax=Aricia agestis TaxID=91739 RepID=UPI001C205BD8|nr:trypsin-like [Aricia agestis]
MLVVLTLLYFCCFYHFTCAQHDVVTNSLHGSPVKPDLLSPGESNAADFDWRIWRGYPIPIEEAPYTVLYGWLCGGTIIGLRFVITAAHCDKEYFVYAGSQLREVNQEYPIKRHIYHPNWSGSEDYDYDLLILTLDRPVFNQDFSKPINLGEEKDLRTGEVVFVSGWGHDTYVFNITKGKSYMSDKLRQVRMSLLEHTDCAARAVPFYAEKFGEKKTITPRMECAEGTEGGPCFGDYGGPVVANNKLVGVASWGIHCEPLLVFINLIPFTEWIDTTMKSN